VPALPCLPATTPLGRLPGHLATTPGLALSLQLPGLRHLTGPGYLPATTPRHLTELPRPAEQRRRA